MLQKISNAFALAFGNIRANLFHTFLSVLGIIIGVGALVSILSLIDGMEELARQQISQTTSLNGIMVQAETHRNANGVRIRKDTVPVITYQAYASMSAALSKPVVAYMRSGASGEATLATDKKVGVNVLAVTATLEPGAQIAIGTAFTKTDVEAKLPVAIANKTFLKMAGIPETEALGQMLLFRDKSIKIVAVLEGEANKSPVVYLPITLLTETELQTTPPDIIFEAEKTETVPLLKTELVNWLKVNYKNADQDFRVLTNEFRVEQVAKGFLVFRLIMGLIVGISVVVGGIGVMNVLLISVTERTAEIGVRKAMGANRRDITLLFLAESVTVSAFGSLAGLAFGIGATMIIIPIVRAVTEMPFQAAYTLNTILVILILALVVGVVFGTYPAIRASKLNPVDAIRHE